MKQKYTVTVADMELNIVSDASPDEVENIVGILDRRSDRHRFADLYRVDAFGIVQRDDGLGPAVRDYVVLVAGCEQRQKERRR